MLDILKAMVMLFGPFVVAGLAPFVIGGLVIVCIFPDPEVIKTGGHMIVHQLHALVGVFTKDERIIWVLTGAAIGWLVGIGRIGPDFLRGGPDA